MENNIGLEGIVDYLRSKYKIKEIDSKINKDIKNNGIVASIRVVKENGSVVNLTYIRDLSDNRWYVVNKINYDGSIKKGKEIK